ncbi:MAG: RloB domain-containing protein [Bacteroidales bacterium]|nr:RloB domain-containing protein [Bacteroidales bacterium]
MSARKTLKATPQRLRESIAVIIDGKDEKWYIEQLREFYSKEKITKIKISPEFPEKKSVHDLFEMAERLAGQSYSHIFLIIDLDNILKDAVETRKFQEKYKVYNTKNKGRKNKWMEKLTIIINSPCLEYWYLLHFKQTNRFYPDYDALKPDLRKSNPILKQYDKSETFYYQSPGLFRKLEPYIEVAKANALPFDILSMHQKGFSEMFKLFDYLTITKSTP